MKVETSSDDRVNGIRLYCSRRQPPLNMPSSDSRCHPHISRTEQKGSKMKTRHPLRRIFASAALVAMIFAAAPAFAKAKTWSFDKDKVQEPPVGWLSEKTGQGSKGDWKVVA